MTQITAHVTARRMARAASELLAALDQRQRAAATFDFAAEEERRRWSYYPREFHGLALRDMSGAQVKLTHNLIEVALSLPAQAKAVSIMALESVLDRIENHARDDRDTGRYFVSFFGDPSGALPWGWRFEGHHVSLHFTLAGDELLGWTPNFLGANPARLTHAGAVVLRPLAEEEDLARELLLSLTGDQRAKAVICDEAPIDFVLTNAARVPPRLLPGEGLQPDFAGNRSAFDRLTPAQKQALAFDLQRSAGLPGSELEDAQRDLLFNLVRVYLDRLPDDAASMALAELEEDVVGSLHFAWAGEVEPRRPHYYRIQGPRFLVEYDNTQNNANHVHSVWRDPDNDFGDLLLRHYLEDHG
ncbi:MAG TPA: DUF3500 domain-containing protein [Dehalococcoidia bacterium]|nr:DUF3500 domain-containing protein [Dehalococcoidia bacterium]